MSVGKVVAARRQLEKMGYITIEKRCAQATLIVRLVDRMAENCQRYAKPAFTTRTERSPHERSVHHMNADLPVQRSCGEPKKKEEEPIEEDALAAAADRDTDPKRGAVFTLYEQNIGALTPLIVDAINMWLAEPQFKTTGEDRASHALETAIREAAASNVRRWTYIHAILKRMARDEIDSPRRPAPANGAPPPTTPSAPPSSPTPRIVIPPPIPLAERQMMAERTRVARLAMGMGGKDAGSEIGNGGNDK
jgi:DnaD/phage-associated family protein